jgi:hypothetical protein
LTAMPPPILSVVDIDRPSPLSLGMRRAFDMAIEDRSQLADSLFAVSGFSGRRFRMFLNNLFSIIENPRYLEVGVFNGGSFIPAIYQNKMKATAIDNWSWEGSNIETFKSYLKEFGGSADVTIINENFRTVDYKSLGPFNVLFYDGSHAEADQFDGVRLPSAAMDRNFICIVDDWNWEKVRRGTFRGFRDAGYRVDSSIELMTKLYAKGDELPEVGFAKSHWHNGMFAASITRL